MNKVVGFKKPREESSVEAALKYALEHGDYSEIMIVGIDKEGWLGADYSTTESRLQLIGMLQYMQARMLDDILNGR